MSDQFAIRRERLQQSIIEDQLDGVLVTKPVNVTYLTGFSGDSSYLLISKSQTILISDGRYTTQIEEECPGLDMHIRPPSRSIQQAAGEILSKSGLLNIACDSGHLTLVEFDALSQNASTIQWKQESGRVEQFRMVKDESEQDQIRSAVKMAERAFAMFRAMLRGKDTEKEMADDLEMYIRRAGGKCSSFPIIVAGGERAALPHASPAGYPVGPEIVLLVDWGVSGANSYKSDLTRVLLNRTKPLSSEDKHKLKNVYSVVLEAQRKAITTVRPGAKGRDVDAVAREVITNAGYGDNFTHSIGHGLGLEIHKAPFMKPEADIELKPGMIVTVEPGIYIPGEFGIRIEDDVLVTDDGCEVLSSVPKDFEDQWIDF